MRENATIYRDTNIIKATKDQVEEDKEILFKIRKNIIDNKDIKYEFINNQCRLDENKNLNKNCSWFLLKTSKIGAKMNKYKLAPGDIIKIGRISLRIRDIHFSQDSSKNNNKKEIFTNVENADFNLKDLNTLRTEANINNNNSSRNYLSKQLNYLSHLKYLEEDDPENNPLLQPCLCSGSLKYIHLTCLKHWISTRSCEKIDTTTYSVVYIIKQVECELCKTKFPDLIKHNDKIHHLLDFSKDFESYLTLESLTLDKYKNKFIYTISLMESNKKLKLGRGHECDILLSDISVSRVHCFLLAESSNKNLYIIDNDSKFGTLVLIQAPFIKIEELLPLHIQIGRTYIRCLVKKPFKFFQCCNVEEYDNIFYYFEQNKVNDNINLIIKSDSMEDNINNNKFLLENYTCQQKYPNIPYYICGHSMGSYLLREYLCFSSQKLSGAIIMGTGYQSGCKASMGINLCKMLSCCRGQRYRSNFVKKMALESGPYTNFDLKDENRSWITSDPVMAKIYNEDQKMKFDFSLNGFIALIEATKISCDSNYASRINKELPILFVSGDNDPVGDNGEGVKKAFNLLKRVGVKDVSLKLFEGDRHEVLNEVNRNEVFEYIGNWLDEKNIN